MKASFNVLDEPWIPVIALDGKENMLGIRQTLLEAHTLREISSASPLEEYALYRFLGLFLMDALRPESEADIEDYLAAGRFDMTGIEKYISLCRNEGVSFNLFDEDRPFLQSPRDDTLDGEQKPVSILDCTRPSGNNHTHFLHRADVEKRIGPDKAARLLLATYLFSTAGAQGYPSSVYGAPPYFGIIMGGNLFETLMHTLLPAERISLELDEPPVLWRRTEPIIPKREIGKTSWLQGMLFPNRRIRLVPDENSDVIGIHLCQGENYVNKESWRDPFVTYRKGKGGLFPLRPSTDRALWRNCCEIVDVSGGTASQLLSFYRTIQSGETAQITLYGVETNQASYLSIYRNSLQLPTSLMDNESSIELLGMGISAAERLAHELGKALSSVKALGDSVSAAAVQQFYADCESRFWQLCDAAGMQGPLTALYKEYCDDVAAIVLRDYTSAITAANLRARSLAEASNAQRMLLRSIGKLKKEASK